jgi:cytochrome c oxidase subunit 2
VTIAAEVALYYAVERHRNNDDPKPTVENRRPEVTWTLAIATVLLFVGLASYGAMAQPAVMSQIEDPEPDRGDVTVDVEAYQLGWNFYDPQYENVSADTKMVLRVDTRVLFSVTSRDIVHFFSVPEMGLKPDAFPGDENVIVTPATEQGRSRATARSSVGSTTPA